MANEKKPDDETTDEKTDTTKLPTKTKIDGKPYIGIGGGEGGVTVLLPELDKDLDVN